MVEDQTTGSKRRKWMMSGVVWAAGPHRVLVATDDAVLLFSNREMTKWITARRQHQI
jgi:hypothetical protein